MGSLDVSRPKHKACKSGDSHIQHLCHYSCGTNQTASLINMIFTNDVTKWRYFDCMKRSRYSMLKSNAYNGSKIGL